MAKASVTAISKDALRQIALNTLLAVAQDNNATASARAAAARTILETMGDIGRLQEMTRRSEKPLSELSPQEINAEIQRLSAPAKKRR